MAAPIVLMTALGVIAGSFISVVAHRVPRRISIVAPRSRCPDCATPIAAYDNVPVVSWLVLRGRCRQCRRAISPSYPLVELALAASFVGAYVAFEGDPARIALAVVLATTLAAITLTDLEQRVIPNRILIASAVIGIVIAAPTDPGGMPERAIAAAGAFAVLFGVAIVHPRGMGIGDVKLAAVLGLYLGRAVVPALLTSFAAGALVGLALIAARGPAARKQAIPFGPFLALGGLVGIFAGEGIVDWYLDSFLR